MGTPIVARAEAEGTRIAKQAKKSGSPEPFERHLADACAALLSGKGKGRAKRPELVVLVSEGVARRGWKDVRDGEKCKIPGVGPVDPAVAREIARDAVLNAVVYDGKDLRHFERWSRAVPIEVAIALELGEPPGFEGVACVDCGNRFRTEFDQSSPATRGGPRPTATSSHGAGLATRPRANASGERGPRNERGPAGRSAAWGSGGGGCQASRPRGTPAILEARAAGSPPRLGLRPR